MRKGFTIIEILIAMMVLFTAITFVNISIKAFNSYQRKSEVYQNFYITALSLKDWVSTQSLQQEHYKGKMNGIDYKFNIYPLIKQNSYSYGSVLGSGNIGDYLITLYRVEMILTQKSMEKKYTFLLTKQLSMLGQDEYSKEAK